MSRAPALETTKLASLLSEVTTTMLGVPFTASQGEERIELLCWRSAILPIGSGEHVHVALASDQAGCRLLGARMFGVALDKVDADMIDDTLRELVNMTAGLIKRTMGRNAALGLPTVLSNRRPDLPSNKGWWRALLRASNDPIEVVLFVSRPEEDNPQ